MCIVTTVEHWRQTWHFTLCCHAFTCVSIASLVDACQALHAAALHMCVMCAHPALTVPGRARSPLVFTTVVRRAHTPTPHPCSSRVELFKLMPPPAASWMMDNPRWHRKYSEVGIRPRAFLAFWWASNYFIYYVIIITISAPPGMAVGCCELRLRSTPRYRLVCICFPTPGRGLPCGSGLGLSRCLGPGECLHSFIQ